MSVLGHLYGSILTVHNLVTRCVLIKTVAGYMMTSNRLVHLVNVFQHGGHLISSLELSQIQLSEDIGYGHTMVHGTVVTQIKHKNLLTQIKTRLLLVFVNNHTDNSY